MGCLLPGFYLGEGGLKASRKSEIDKEETKGFNRASLTYAHLSRYVGNLKEINEQSLRQFAMMLKRAETVGANCGQNCGQTLLYKLFTPLADRHKTRLEAASRDFL